MKIVVKECDVFNSTLFEDKTVSQYIIYVMLDDNTPLGCEYVLGEDEVEIVIKSFISRMYANGDITITPNDTLECVTEQMVERISFEEFNKTINED